MLKLTTTRCFPLSTISCLRLRAKPSCSLARSRSLVMNASGMDSVEMKESPSRDVFAVDKRPVILFDGVCNFCNGGVNLVLSLDSRKSFRFAALQSETGRSLLQRCNRDPEDISSMVVVEENAFHIRSDAALKIGEKLNIPFPLLSAMFSFVPKPARDRGYDWIAENRYQLFGMRDECRLSDKTDYERFLT